MQRLTISLDEYLAAGFDGLVAECGYAQRCEAVRGPAPQVRSVAAAVRAGRGVHAGKPNLISVEAHPHPRHEGEHKPQLHLRPVS